MVNTVPVTTRFAPSPTGFLHLGHAYAALFAERAARNTGGRFLLRMENIDPVRCRTEFETALMQDLAWLGLAWEQPVRRQSECMADYAAALERLRALGLLYPCFCTRKTIQAEIQAAQGAPHLLNEGPDGPVYPGVCRHLSAARRKALIQDGTPFALRLDMARAIEMAGPLTWRDLARGEMIATPEIFGDVVLARKDIPASYHLAASLDDHIQKISLVTRGVDLFAATHVQRLLQAVLNLNTPDYHHHKLIMGPHGNRLAKRDHGETLRNLRKTGHCAQDVRHMI